jgi:hypothetical protein
MRRARLALAALLVVTPALAQDDADPHAGSPHGGGAIPGVFQPPPDTVEEDPSLPAGSFSATILDLEDHPIPHAMVTIGILHNTVAKGESRSRTLREADDAGSLRLDNQETGTGVAYRLSVPKDGATFGAAPFQLPQARGMRVRLHVYPVTHKLKDALIVMQSIVYAELKDDRLQLQSAVQIFNFGKVAWVPEGADALITLPPDFTAFRANEDMGDRGVDPVEQQGARLRGTFAPGRWDVDWRWQLPYSGEKELSFDVGLPPNTAVARVMAQASQQMTLTASGFDPPQPRFDGEGQRVLVTERQIRRDEPLRSVQVTIGNLPTQGPGRFVAVGLAALAVAGGLGFAFTQRKPWKGKKELDKLERGQLLAELEELERTHAAGEVGPKTYERARREIIDALARTLSRADSRQRSAIRPSAREELTP